MAEGLGDRILRRRLALGWNRRQLQREIGEGCSYPYLSDIEKGAKVPSAVVVSRIAAALGCTAGDLLDPDPTPAAAAVLSEADIDDIALAVAEAVAAQLRRRFA